MNPLNPERKFLNLLIMRTNVQEAQNKKARKIVKLISHPQNYTDPIMKIIQ